MPTRNSTRCPSGTRPSPCRIIATPSTRARSRKYSSELDSCLHPTPFEWIDPPRAGLFLFSSQLGAHGYGPSAQGIACSRRPPRRFIMRSQCVELRFPGHESPWCAFIWPIGTMSMSSTHMCAQNGRLRPHTCQAAFSFPAVFQQVGEGSPFSPGKQGGSASGCIGRQPPLVGSRIGCWIA
jgi:hypothetical protein